MSDEQADIFSIEVPLDGDAVQVRDATKRELDIRLLSWGEVINTQHGTEEFSRGAFDVADPSRVRLMGMEHAAQFGVGQDGKPVLVRVPTGKGIAFEDRDDGPHMTFRVAKTSAGDDQLALATEGIVTGASVEFNEVPGGTVTEKRGTRRHRRHVRVDLSGLTTTYRPAYTGGAVLAVRTEEATVSETNGASPEVAVTVAPTPDYGPQIVQMGSSIEDILGRLEAMKEETRAKFDLPAAPTDDKKADATLGDWSSVVFRMLTGEKISQKEIEFRVAAELITTDNLGVVPEQFLDEIIGIIDPSRPFLQTTRRLQTPAAGMTFNVPVITTRPTVGVQAAEKDELTSTPTSITDTSFTPLTIGGYGDISIQLLKRSDPSYLSLYIELLSEAYGIMADDRAVDALLAAAGLNNGGSLDPENLSIGGAWANAVAVSRRLTPDTIWLSSDGVARFINAKADGTNQQLYGNLGGAFSAAGGTGGTISGLRPVHVPALDDEAADVIIGPSRGFAWAEDGTYTLQVDVPALAGREVALVGMIWFMPLYPAAFTRYALTAT
jgi:HK97 family phage major capsid protein